MYLWLTVFKGIHATDRDKPNTPNSEIHYSITAGNEKGKFGLDNSHEGYLVLKKPLDYDNGDREFLLTISASDRGVPQRSSNATIKVSIQDNDDLPPKFTKGVYRTKISESYPITGEKIHKLLEFDPPILAFDQDRGIDTAIRYDIIAGNERHLFYLDHVNGSLFLEREIDLDSERSLPANTFVLQIQASQLDNPVKTGVARVEVEILDLNDNLPEFEVDLYNISIVENLPNGFSVLQVIASDQDQGDNGEFSYQLEDRTKAFTMDSRTGWITVRDQTILDREKRSTIKMRVYAKEKVPTVVTNTIGVSSVAVEITLLDANDNNPTFIPNNIYEFNVTTDTRVGDPVGQIHAIDPDLARNGMVIYTIKDAANTSAPFKIDPRTGRISITEAPLPIGRHLLFIEATDQPVNPSEKRVSLAVVTIDVKAPGHSDGLPDFIGAPYEFWVGGNVDVGTSVGQIRITEDHQQKKISYDLLHSYDEGVPFAVEEKSGTITVVDDLSKYDRILYDFEAVVTDENTIALVTNATIHVVDFDDNIFINNPDASLTEFHVKENQNSTIIGTLMPENVTIKDLSFVIANENDVTDCIAISSAGTLYTLKPLDREDRAVYRLTIIAEYSRGGVNSKSGVYQASIYVDDENDNAPQFERELYEGRIKENSIAGTEVELNYPIHVKDADVGENAEFTVTIFGNGSEMFRLDRSTGKVYFNSGSMPLDREEKSSYLLRLVAKDNGNLSSEAKLVIKIEDENDNAPQFTQMNVILNKDIQVVEYDKGGAKITRPEDYSNGTTSGLYMLLNAFKTRGKNNAKVSPVISLPEDIAVGTTVLQLVAEDKDSLDNAVIKYELISETYIPNEHNIDPFHVTQYFMINSMNGDVIVARTLPPESEFRLNITAADKKGLKDFVILRIFIKDVNDHPPVFKKSWYNFDAEEINYSTNVLGRIEATDADFGMNANVSYSLKTDSNEMLPFEISENSGLLKINGQLDRETRDKYSFYVIAYDNPTSDKSLSSSVNVEVNILDINDNAPVFYGYDDLITIDENTSIPVYYATASENTPLGTPISRVFANDSDFSGNGNGLLLFDIPYHNNLENLFAIDSKDGIVTTIGKLDYERSDTHNLTITASDLGSPSLTSTALMIVRILDVPEDMSNPDQPVFAHRYYEVEVEENVPIPLKLLTLNVTDAYRNYRLRYSIVADKDSEIKRTFKIDPKNGSLYIIESPDREIKDRYEIHVRLDQYKVGRDMTVMVYPVTNEKLSDIGLNEVKIIVRVTDLNDNVPRFTITGRPIVAAVPASANFGYQIIKLQAKDADLGINGEVRYQILGRADEVTRRFAIDPITGQVRAVSNFIKDAGKIYGFDVKATDRRGADDGKSSIANVFVYVLDEQKQLIMVMGSKPTDVEKDMENITLVLYNSTGFDIRVRKLEPHADRKQVDNGATDMYLYAVDPLLNVLGGSTFKCSGRYGCLTKSSTNQTTRNRTKFRQIQSARKRLLKKSYAHSHQMGYTLASTLGKPTLFPSSFAEGIHYGDTITTGPSHRGYRHHQHDVNCPRFTGRRTNIREGSRSIGGMETSITSLHSSGQDSGIVDTGIHCQCGQSSTQSSGEDSTNYEDSLKSVHHKCRSATLKHDSKSPHRRERKGSLSEDMLQQRSSFVHPSVSNHSHLPHTGTLLAPGTKRSSERLMMS
ncbi:Cadherin domain [Popillia japonica]|uniref:Cadherin domain n=1 Tax=Popillia japonica TaxID=7064 RepID=A0AAW1NAV4_POPJA